MDQADPRPTYKRVADDLRQSISAGTYGPGDQLPTLAELTDRYGIAVMTARDAIRELVAEGIVVSRQGKGAYVLSRPASDASTSVSELLGLFKQISRTVDDLADRMDAVEQRLSTDRHPDGAQSQPDGD